MHIEAPKRPIYLYPGEVGELDDLNDSLAARHAEFCEAQARRIAEEKANGVPNNEHVIEPFVRAPHLEGVRVQCEVLREDRRRTLSGKEGAALARLRVALHAQDHEAIADSTNALFAARRAFVAEAVARIEIEHAPFAVDVKQPAALDGLERNGLLIAVFEVAAAFQELGPGKVLRSGSSAASTSGASSVPSAPSTGALDAVVSAAPSATRVSLGTSLALAGRPTSAPGGT